MLNNDDMLLVPFKWNAQGIDSVIDNSGSRASLWWGATFGPRVSIRITPNLSDESFPMTHVVFMDHDVLFEGQDNTMLEFIARAARETIGQGHAIVVTGHGSRSDPFNIYTSKGVKCDASMLGKAIVKLIELSGETPANPVEVYLRMCFATLPHVRHGMQEFITGKLMGSKVKRSMVMEPSGLMEKTKLTIMNQGIPFELKRKRKIAPRDPGLGSYAQEEVDKGFLAWSFAEKLSWIVSKKYQVNVNGTSLVLMSGQSVSGGYPVQPKVPTTDNG